MTFAAEWTEERSREMKERDGWSGHYDGTECSRCGRERVMKCSNGKRVCEKCGWDQDANGMSAMPRDMIG